MAPTGVLIWNNFRFDFMSDGKVLLNWQPGASTIIGAEATWTAFKKSTIFTGSIFFADFNRQQSAHNVYGSDNADTITRTTGGGIHAGGGNDTISAYVSQDQTHDNSGGSPSGHVEQHIYAARGSDTLHLNFSKINQSYVWGHHVQGEGNDMISTADVLSADTFNFQLTTAEDSSTGALTGIFGGRVAVGRLEDYDFSRDKIQVNGTEVNLRDLPSNMEIVYHNGSLNSKISAGFDLQAWLVIRTGTAALGYGHVVYALEADRANPSTIPNVTYVRETESHFISEDAANEIIALFNQAGRATYVDPQNFVPDGYVVQGAGQYINDYDTNITSANELISGTAAGDLIAAGVNNDTVFADLGNDRIWGGSGHDALFGEEGNDSLSGNSGNDVFNGGTGTDTAVFKSGVTASVNLLVTTAQQTGEGRDTFVSIENVATSFGHDTVTGNHGVNLIQTGSGNDLVYAKDGADRVETGNGSDDLYGDDGDDDLFGGDGADALMGGNGLDSLVGGTGNDTLMGQAGADTLDGDAGDDVFRFQSETDGADYIVDFSGVTGNNDRFSINATNFGGGLTGGNITAAQFQILTATDRLIDSSDRFIYDMVDNKLYFDANGSAAGQRYHIATFSSAVTLSNTDFWLMS